MIDALKWVVCLSFYIGLVIVAATTPPLIVPLFILLLWLRWLIKENLHNLTTEDDTEEGVA